jgi:glycosyltransferase involved in cell wall biosynthesis
MNKFPPSTSKLRNRAKQNANETLNCCRVINNGIQISVVVPVYNAAKTIERCVESLVSQELMPTEIVLVDDGSKDNSLDVCRRLADKHNIIKVVHQGNKGVTKARAQGVEMSIGSWITFVDADDYLPLDALKLLASGVDGDKYDIVVGEPIFKSNPRVLSNELYRSLIITGGVSAGPFAKLFRRDLFNETTFDIPRHIVFGEDMLMNIRLAFATNRPVNHIGRKVYEYVAVNTSVSHSFSKTAEYEEAFHLLRMDSIPSMYHDKYFVPILKNRINGWRGMNFVRFNVTANKNSEFYRHILQDVRTSGYRLSLSERIHLTWTSFPARIIAVGLNVLSVLVYKINRKFGV